MELSSLQPPCKRCGSQGSFLTCFCQRLCCPWDGGLFPCIWNPLRHRLCCRGRETEREEPGLCRHLYHIRCCKVQGLCHCRRGGQAPGSWVLQLLEGWGPRLQCNCCPVTCSCGHLCGWVDEVVCAIFPAATGFSVAVGSIAMVRGLWVQTLSLLFPQFPFLYVIQSTHLLMYRCLEFSVILLCWAEAALLSYGCFNSCRLKGRDKSSFSLHRVSDVTPGLQFLREVCELKLLWPPFVRMPFLPMGE